MNDNVINIDPNCRACDTPLTIEEMHYFDSGNGAATCCKCEEAWFNKMNEWREGDGPEGPPPPP